MNMRNKQVSGKLADNQSNVKEINAYLIDSSSSNEVLERDTLYFLKSNVKYDDTFKFEEVTEMNIY